MRSDDRTVDHQIFVVFIPDQVGKDLIPDALGRPAGEAFMDRLEFAVALREVRPPRP